MAVMWKKRNWGAGRGVQAQALSYSIRLFFSSRRFTGMEMGMGIDYLDHAKAEKSGVLSIRGTLLWPDGLGRERKIFRCSFNDLD